MNISILIRAGLVGLVILVVFLIIRKRVSGKPSAAVKKEIPRHPAAEEPPVGGEQGAAETAIDKAGKIAPGEEEETEQLGEKERKAVEPGVLQPEEEAVAGPQAEPEPEPEPEPVAEERPASCLSLRRYEQQLLEFREQRLNGLAGATGDDEQQQEQLHAELVAITETLNFLESSYEQEISCRNQVLESLGRLEMEPEEYEQVLSSIKDGDTVVAGQVLDDVAGRNPSRAALASYLGGRLAECRIVLNEAMNRYEQAVILDNDNPEYLRTVSALARRLYHHKKALAWSRRLVELLEAEDEDTVELALARRDLAYTTALAGRYKQAGGRYKQAMVSLTRLKGANDPEMGICWLQIGKLQETMGQYEKADSAYTKALAIMKLTDDQAVLGEILEKLAGLYMELEREKEAIPLLERLRTMKGQSSHPDRASQIVVYNNLAEAWRICGGYAEAEENYLHSLAITEELRGPEHPAVGSILQELDRLCQRQGKNEEAEEYRQRASVIFQRLMDEQDKAGQEDVQLTLEE